MITQIVLSIIMLILLAIIIYLLNENNKKDDDIRYFVQAALDFQDELNDCKKDKEK